MSKTILITVLLVLIVGAVVVAYQFYLNQPKPELNQFAQCVTTKGWTMYGAYWCGHCQNEKRAYGSAFQYIKYVECAEQTEVCNQQGISGFPTWIGPNGEREEGELGLEKMAELSGCVLPAS